MHLLLLLLPLLSPHINTDPINSFWRVVDQLKHDKPLTDSLWNAYYDQPGNKVYMEKNRPPYEVEEHRRYLEFVFRPSMRDSIRTLPPQNDDILDNLLYIQQHERELR